MHFWHKGNSLGCLLYKYPPFLPCWQNLTPAMLKQPDTPLWLVVAMAQFWPIGIRGSLLGASWEIGPPLIVILDRNVLPTLHLSTAL